MIVNNEKLKRILEYITRDCSNCPIEGKNICKTQPYSEDKCVKVLMHWLQEFKTAKVPKKSGYGVPCEEEDGQCNISCPFHWTEWCPYSE